MTLFSRKTLEIRKKYKEEKRKVRKKKNSKSKSFKFFSKIGSFFSSDKDSYSFSEVFIITLASLLVGAFACFSVFMIFTGGRNYFKISKDLDKFYDVYNTIINNYYDDVSKEELIDAAINGMVSSVGDEYTSYMDTNSTDDFNELVNGVYEGIGCVIQLSDVGVKVIEVYEDGPAYEAGLRSGDIILKIDNNNYKIDEVGIENIDVIKISNYIKVESDGNIKIDVLRENDEMSFILKRKRVEIPVTSRHIYETNGKKVGYIGLSIFSSVSANQFEKELTELEKEGIDGLVIDVRGNNGGYLTSVDEILNMLIPKGEILYQVEKGKNKEVTRDKTKSYRKYPIAVLVNGASASASEILAAAIKESYEDGYVVGTKSYGKGTVQQIKYLSDGSMIKYTVENWLTPDGNWIDGVGVEPTEIIELDKVYYENPITENDNQLKKALELVSK